MSLVLAALALFGCINATQEALDISVRNLKIADAALEVDDFDKTRKWVETAVVFIEDVKASTDPKDGVVRMPGNRIGVKPDAAFLRRVYRIRALVRSRDPKSSQAARDEGMTMFETYVLGAAPDPTILADYAEMLSRVPARAPQALMMLRSQDAKDLIGSDHAYAALAELERQAGDASAEKAARAKCRTRTKKASICG